MELVTDVTGHCRKKISTVKKQYCAFREKAKWHGIEGGTVFGGPVFGFFTVHRILTVNTSISSIKDITDN